MEAPRVGTMAQYFDAKDKSFLISGGATGLGAEYAKVFLSKGAKVIIILDIAEELGRVTAERLNKLYNEKVVFIKCDISKEEDIKNAFESVIAQFKQIDVIINNAGIMSDAPDLWRTACDVNWQGLVSLTLKGVKHMRKDEGGAGGTIINISSTAGINKYPFLPLYNASKLAVLHFSQCLAMNSFYDRTAIRVFTIVPGSTDTSLMQNLEARTYDPNLGRIFAEVVNINTVVYQRVEFAAAALGEVFKNGAPGSIWLIADNKPAKDITAVINNVFQILGDETNSNDN